MSDGQVLTKKNNELLAKFLLDKFKKDIPWWMPKKIIEKLIIKGLEFVGEKADKVIPDNIDSHINAGLVHALNKRWDEAGAALSLIPTKVLDLKALTPEEEKNLWNYVNKIILNIVKNWIDKK